MRHSRQTILPEVGAEGQERLRHACVGIVGAGGLGSVAAELLVRAGVGRIVIMDYDLVELSNLQRQSLYTERDVGKPKALAAKERLAAIDRGIRVDASVRQLNLTTLALLDDADLVLDCTDNLQTRSLLNEWCMKTKRPFIYTGAVETRGMLYVVDPAEQGRACFNCIFDRLKSVENCEDFGVLNVTVHLAATLQAAEAMKILLKKPYTEGLVSFDAWDPRLERFAVRRNPSCPVCAGRYDRLAGKGPRVEFCATKRCVKARPNKEMTVDLGKLRKGEGVRVLEEYGGDGLRILIDGVEALVYPHGGLELRTKDQDRAKEITEKVYAAAR